VDEGLDEANYMGCYCSEHGSKMLIVAVVDIDGMPSHWRIGREERHPTLLAFVIAAIAMAVAEDIHDLYAAMTMMMIL